MVGQFSENHLKQCYVLGEFNKYILKRKLHGCLEIQNFSFDIQKYFTCSLHSLVKYFHHLKRNCVSLHMYSHVKSSKI